jgi:hypothetical protein
MSLSFVKYYTIFTQVEYIQIFYGFWLEIEDVDVANVSKGKVMFKTYNSSFRVQG